MYGNSSEIDTNYVNKMEPCSGCTANVSLVCHRGSENSHSVCIMLAAFAYNFYAFTQFLDVQKELWCTKFLNKERLQTFKCVWQWSLKTHATLRRTANMHQCMTENAKKSPYAELIMRQPLYISKFLNLKVFQVDKKQTDSQNNR